MAEYHPIQTYGSGYILFSHLQEALEELGGRIVIHVVEAEDGQANDLVYGLFYEDKHGRYFDVLQQRNALLKTFTRADTMVSALARIGQLSIGGVPALVESNKLLRGGLHFKSENN